MTLSRCPDFCNLWAVHSDHDYRTHIQKLALTNTAQRVNDGMNCEQKRGEKQALVLRKKE